MEDLASPAGLGAAAGAPGADRMSSSRTARINAGVKRDIISAAGMRAISIGIVKRLKSEASRQAGRSSNIAILLQVALSARGSAARVVARVCNPWLAVRREDLLWHGHPARGSRYTASIGRTRPIQARAQRSSPIERKSRLRDCWYRWHTIDRCGVTAPMG